MDSRQHRPHGFTLIEMLVVVAIIAMLVALLLPVLGAAKEQARRVACSSQMRQVTVILTTYDSDYRELPSGMPLFPSFIGNYIHIVLRNEYNMTESLVSCPSAGPFPGTYRPWTSNQDKGRLTYNYFAGYADYTGSAAVKKNNWIAGNFPARNQGFFPPLNIREVERPEREPYMFDLAYMYEVVSSSLHKPTRSNHSDGSVDAAGENVAFVDGHVEWHKFVELQTWRYHHRNQWTWWTPSFTIASPPLHVP